MRLLVCVVATALGAVAGTAGWNLSRQVPPSALAVVIPQSLVLDTPAGTAVPNAATGMDAISDSISGVVASRASTVPTPTASIAKTMTALAVLQSDPLAPGQSGPTLTVTAADVTLLDQIEAGGGSFAPVEAGEVLTERQLLEGLMLPSANNFAVMLADWVGAGSESAFVVRLNQMALRMGMTATHFDDPDGLDPGTVSNAHDLLILGTTALANQTLRGIVAETTATLPDGTVVDNIDSLLGTVPGWLGIKTGNTGPAGYCLLFAAERTVAPGTTPITVVGVVLDQPNFATVFSYAEAAVTNDLAGYHAVDLAALSPPLSGHVTTPWGGSAALQLGPPHGGTPVLLRWGTHQRLTVTVQTLPLPRGPDPRYARIGTLQLLMDGHVEVNWPIELSTPLAPPSLLWRALHG